MDEFNNQVLDLFNAFEQKAEEAYVSWLGGHNVLNRIKSNGWEFTFLIPRHFAFQAVYIRVKENCTDEVVHTLAGVRALIDNQPTYASSKDGLMGILGLGQRI